MVCPKCGRQVIDGSVICPGCGGNLNSEQNINQQSFDNNQYPNFDSQNVNDLNNGGNNKKKFNFIPIIIVVVILVVIVCFIILSKKPVSNKGNSNTNDEINFNVENELSDEEVKKLTTCTYDIFDTNIVYTENDDFFMAIEDVFTITGKGVFITGKIRSGTVNVGDKVQVIGIYKEIINTEVLEIEQYRESVKSAKIDESVGIRLKGVSREQVERGMVLIKPNSFSAKTTFEADIKLMTKEQGGIRDAFLEAERVNYYFFTTDHPGQMYFAEGLNKINPGDCAKVVIELRTYAPMEIGTTFSIRDGGRTIGAGVVTETDISKIKYSKDIIDPYSSERNDPDREFVMYVDWAYDHHDEVEVTGKVEKGKLFVNDEVQIISSNGKSKKTSKVIDIGYSDEFVLEGDNAKIYLSGITKDDVEKGDKIILKNK